MSTVSFTPYTKTIPTTENCKGCNHPLTNGKDIVAHNDQHPIHSVCLRTLKDVCPSCPQPTLAQKSMKELKLVAKDTAAGALKLTTLYTGLLSAGAAGVALCTLVAAIAVGNPENRELTRETDFTGHCVITAVNFATLAAKMALPAVVGTVACRKWAHTNEVRHSAVTGAVVSSILGELFIAYPSSFYGHGGAIIGVGAIIGAGIEAYCRHS